MGCPLSVHSSPSDLRLEQLKLDDGYKARNRARPNVRRVVTRGFNDGDVENHKNDRKGNGVGGGEKLEAKEGEKREGSNKRGRLLGDDWPKWRVDNIPGEVLAGLVKKSADSYDKLAKIGQGTYSNVYKARDKDTGKIVALKKVRFDTSEPESVKFMAREIMILQQLDHPNVIKLEGVATSRMQYSIYLVFDFMQSDLTKVICRPDHKLTELQVKCYMKELLSGLEHCHEKGILHRDIKASNLLIDKKGVLKIADFGLANFFNPKPKRPLTNRVVTLWYRAPELLLGSTDYGVGIDLWSAGCLLGEMFAARPIMPGRTEVEQLHRIFKLCGSPPEDYWKKMKLPTSFRPPQPYKQTFQETFKDIPSSSFSLLTMLLSLDPADRGTAASALKSDFFNTSPLACRLSDVQKLNKEEKPTRTNDHKKRKKKKSSRTIAGQGKESLKSIKAKAVVESSKEVGKSLKHSTNSKEAVMAASAAARQMMKVTLSPVARPRQKTLGGTEAHPSASKNIQNYILLQASISDIMNINKNNDSDQGSFSQFRRSISTLDFRTLDTEKISKLFGLENSLRVEEIDL